MAAVRCYGRGPYHLALLHGGPGAAGEMASVAQVLQSERDLIEPLQTALTLNGQVEELQQQLQGYCTLPVTLVGFSWGAWLAYLYTALHPERVERLILISSGSFDAGYVASMNEQRQQRLSREEWRELQELTARLLDSGHEEKDQLFARLGTLYNKADSVELLDEDTKTLQYSYDIYQGVWPEAERMRNSGELLALGRNITCPVYAIHGAQDPHPAAGVEQPLRKVLSEFHFTVLPRCGHTPWRERWAREAFFQQLNRALA